MSDPGERTTRAGARIECEGLVRIYASSETEVVALQGLDLAVEPGEIVSVIGASGSGKSTLLNILAGLDKPTAGRILVDDEDLLALQEDDRLVYRRNVVGFVWQQTSRNLLPYLSAADNIRLPLALTRSSKGDQEERVATLLGFVGLSSRSHHRPSELSGGEQQRVAIAVALANQPRLLLADEPTGELDSETAAEVITMLTTTAKELGVTTMIVTHDQEVARSADRTITIRDGRVSSERRINQWAGGMAFEREHVVLDKAGRLQLPDEHVRALGLDRLVQVDLDDGFLRIERGEE